MATGDLCPSWSGERLCGFIYRHDTAYPLPLPEDSTQAADHQRLLGNRGSFVRAGTDVEHTLAAWIGMPDADKISIDNPLTVKVDCVGTRHRLLRVRGRAWFDVRPHESQDQERARGDLQNVLRPSRNRSTVRVEQVSSQRKL